MNKIIRFQILTIVLILGSMAYSQAWDEQRRQEVKGTFEASGVVNISQQALNNPFETISKLSVESNEAGYWLTEVELLPGPNRIIVQGGGETEERTVTFRITPPDPACGSYLGRSEPGL